MRVLALPPSACRAVLPFSSNHTLAVNTLRAAIQAALEKGSTDTTPLRAAYRGADALWREWHESTALTARSAARSIEVHDVDSCRAVQIYATTPQARAWVLGHARECPAQHPRRRGTR